MQKLLPLLALSCLLAACSPSASTDVSADAGAEAGEHDASMEMDNAVHVGADWMFADAGTEGSEPHQTVTLMLTGGVTQEIDLGQVPGSCAEKKQEEVMSMRKNHPGIVTSALCWWAGAGTEFIVRQTPENTLVVEKRNVAEEESDAGIHMAAEAVVTVGTPLALPAEAEVMGLMQMGN